MRILFLILLFSKLSADPVASMLYHVHTLIDQENHDHIAFTEEEVADLWEQVPEIDPTPYYSNDHEQLVAIAKQLEKLWHQRFSTQSREETQRRRDSFSFSASPRSFAPLRLNSFAKSPQYNDIDDFPLPKKKLKKIKKYVLDDDHPLRPTLDELFLSSRVTQDLNHLTAAGFWAKFIQPRSFIIVAYHNRLPGYLLKLQLDNEQRVKEEKPYWEWFMRRCDGAKTIRRIIKDNYLKYFTVPHKWMYPLPLEPAVPNTSEYDQKLFVVVAEDMNLIPYWQNLEFWQTKIDKKHLRELYKIIANCRPSSFRADNVAFTHSGKIAFIDTEYRSKKGAPKFNSIRPFLSEKMQKFWDRLVKKGGRA